MTARTANPLGSSAPDSEEPLTADITDSQAGDIPTEIAALRETVAKLTALNEQQAAQLAELAGPATWLALLACERGGYTSEALRKWCKTGKVESRREGASWFVNTRSLAAHLKRLGLAKAIKSAP